MAKEPAWERRELEVPEELHDGIVELLTFIQFPEYTASFRRLELTDDEQCEIEIGIMMDPLISPVIDGTGGIRRFDCGTPGDGPGSLEVSVFYIYFPESSKVALIDAMLTETVGEMSAESRAELKALVEEVQQVGPEAWEG